AALERSIRGPPRLRYGDRAATPFRRIPPVSSKASKRCSSSRQQQASHRRGPSSSLGSRGRAKVPFRTRPQRRANGCPCRKLTLGYIGGAVRPKLAQPTSDRKAIEILQSGCPKDLPSIPTGRLSVMESRLQVMLAAVQTVRPALERFYRSLSDEQKARFNAIAPTDNANAVGKDQHDLANCCDEKSPSVTDLPIDPYGQKIQAVEKTVSCHSRRSLAGQRWLRFLGQSIANRPARRTNGLGAHPRLRHGDGGPGVVGAERIS